MRCPECLAETTVLETRGEDVPRRRRQCLGPLEHRFSTHEVELEELIRLRAMREQLLRLASMLGPLDVDLSTQPAGLVEH